MGDIDQNHSSHDEGKGQSSVGLIMERTERNRAYMQKLEEDISVLEQRKPLEAFKSLLGSKSLPEAIRDTHKRARNLGEDLIEDQLDLDMLDGLSDADRALRKKAIADIDALLDDADKAKSRCDVLLKAATSEGGNNANLSTLGSSLKPFKLKVELDGDIRRNDLATQAEPTVQDVRKAVGQLYALEPDCADRLQLQFTDSMGAQHTLADDTLSKALSAEAPKRILRLTGSRL